MDNLNFVKKLLEIGDKKGALKELHEVIKNDPANIEAWFLCVEATEEIEQKKDCYRSIIKLDPYNTQAQKELKILISSKQVAITPNQPSEEIPGHQMDIGQPTNEIEPNNLLQAPRSDKLYRIVLPIEGGILGIILIILGILFFNKAIKSKSPEIVSNQPASKPVIIIPTNRIVTTPQLYNPTPTKTPIPTLTQRPTRTPSSHLWSGPPRLYVPFEYPRIQSYYVTLRDDEQTIKNADYLQIEFALNNINTGLALPMMYAFQIIVANSAKDAEVAYDGFYNYFQSDTGDMNYQSGGSTYNSILFDDAFQFAGGHDARDILTTGRCFRIDNVSIVISISYSSSLPIPDANSIIADLDGLTEIIIQRFK